jgi:hypothetical protein
MLRFPALGLATAAAACACIAVAIGASTACLTAPPPDLSQQPVHRPTILHDAVQPPPDQILAAIPVEFLVPVELDDPNQSFQWDVFVDYDPEANPNPVFFPTLVQPTPGTVDGGIATVDFSLQHLAGSALDAARCHRIDFLVAHAFNNTSPHAWDSIGGDLVSWLYNPGGDPAGCPVYDAGSLQDGAFPAPDAPPDGLPVVPESGPGESGTEP